MKRKFQGFFALLALALCLTPFSDKAQSVPYQEPIWVITGSPEGVVKAPAGSVYLNALRGELYVKSTQSYLNTGWVQIAATNTVVNPAGSMTFTNTVLMTAANSASPAQLVLEDQEVVDANYPYTVIRQTRENGVGILQFSRETRSGGTNSGLGFQIFQTRQFGGQNAFEIDTDNFWINSASTIITGDFTSQSLVEKNQTVTVNTTLSATSTFITYGDATAGNITITLPIITGLSGRTFWIYKIDSSVNSVTINGNGSNINGSPTMVIASRYSGVKVSCRAGLEWVVQ